jgi:aspartate kinase
MMKVLKFGGTSVGSAQRIKSVADIIVNDEPKIVVLSAMSGTTNELEKICNLLYSGDKVQASGIITDLEHRYKTVTKDLFSNEDTITKADEFIASQFEFIKAMTKSDFSKIEERTLMAQGELLSTHLMHMYLNERDVKSLLIPAIKFMRIDKDHEPDEFYIRENLSEILRENDNHNLFITQGFICKDATGQIDNLKRGGSDYSASLIGAAIGASEIQIWTDIDGFHNNDPRYVENTRPIDRLTFDEAAELAYFGAKILHPSSIRPAQKAGINVRLKNTMNPMDHGTLITDQADSIEIKAVAAKDNITVVKIKSDRMLLAYGFLRKVFEVFEEFKTPIDMITTSEIAVSLTIDDTTHLDEITRKISQYAHVTVDKDLTIVCVVGDFIAEKRGVACKVFDALKETPIRMISYGGSSHNISLLIKSDDKKKALQSFSEHILK